MKNITYQLLSLGLSITITSGVLVVVLGGYIGLAPSALHGNPAGAQGNLCSPQTTQLTLNFTISNKIPTRLKFDEGGKIEGGNAAGVPTTGNVYAPPILVERVKFDCPQGLTCWGNHRFFLGGIGGALVDELIWNGSVDQNYTNLQGGGMLIDWYEDHTSNGAFGALPGTFLPATIITYNLQQQTTQLSIAVNELGPYNAGAIATALGTFFIDNSGQNDQKLWTEQTVTIALTGPGKMGLGSPTSTTLKNQAGQIVISSLAHVTDFMSTVLMVCKDQNNNGTCDDQECTLAQCSDTIDNDADGKIDFPTDPGCESASDLNETNPQCNDGLDNDGDGEIDYPDDIGCQAPIDNDEINPSIDRNVGFQQLSKPQLIIQPALEQDERLVFAAPSAGWTLTTTPDASLYIGGSSPADDGNFIITAEYKDPNNNVYYVIVAVGDYEQHSALSTSGGLPYSGAAF